MTSPLSLLRTAFGSLDAHRTRSALTAFGIGIAVAAVVSVTGVAMSARASLTARVASLGSNVVLVLPHHIVSASPRERRESLTDGDVDAVRREVASVHLAAPWLSTRGRVVNVDRAVTANVTGTTTDFFAIRGWSFETGTTWSGQDEALKSRVCVLGKTTSRRLFGEDVALGRSIRIGRYAYSVIGVLAPKGEDPAGGDQDDVVVMPISSLRARVARVAPGFAGSILVSAVTESDVTYATAQVDSLLRQRHGLDPAGDADFSIHTQHEFQALQDSIGAILAGLLLAIAGVSLVVGGVGVMNVMLVTLTERTREIGIRIAIGATAAETRLEFLAESALLTLFGGSGGAVVGAGVAALVSWAMDWPITVSGAAVLAGLTISALTGIVFGAMPAWRAGTLQPAEAIRAE